MEGIHIGVDDKVLKGEHRGHKGVRQRQVPLALKDEIRERALSPGQILRSLALLNAVGKVLDTARDVNVNNLAAETALGGALGNLLFRLVGEPLENHDRNGG